MSRAVFYAGSAGAGKSTLLNKISGTNEAVVSDKLLEDGTEGVQSIKDPKDVHLLHLDLPGLDSRNFPCQVTETIQNRHPSVKLLPVLVLSRGSARLTNIIQSFKDIKKELVGQDAEFAIVWTRDGTVSEANRRAVQDFFPTSRMFEDSDIAGIRAYFSNTTLFKVQLKTVAKQNDVLKLAAQVPVPSVMRPMSAYPAAQVVPAVVRVPVRSYPLGPPAHLLTVAGFKGSSPDPKFDTFLARILAIKKFGRAPDEGDEVDVEDRFRLLKYMGDAHLKSFVSHFLYAKGERSELQIKTLMLIGNGTDCAMYKFFQKYMAVEFKLKFPNEANITEHNEVDVVEALLELALSSGKLGARVFRFMIIEFLKLVGLESILNK